MNLYSAVNRVLKRLDDYPTPAGEREWPREEVELYVRDGYNAFARRTKAVFDMFYPENLPTAGNYVAKWEENYFAVGWLATGLLNFTGGYWETDYSDHGGVGPVNHTVFWEDEYLEDTFQLASETVPEDNVTVERGTFNNIDLDPEYTRWYEEHDRNFQTVGGDPNSFAFDRDGIRGLRPVPAGTASATSVEIDQNNPLVGYWPLDEASGTRYDMVGSMHLSPTNTPGATTAKIGNGATFTAGSSQLLGNSDSLLLDGALGFTIHYWVYIPTGAPTNATFFYDGDGALSDIQISTANVAPLRHHVTLSNDAGEASQAALTLSLNDTWYFIAVKYDPATMKVSISADGGAWTEAAAALVTDHPTIDDSAPGEFQIGGRNGSYSTSRMDEVAVWNTVLTDAQLADALALTRPDYVRYTSGFGLLRLAGDDDGLGTWEPSGLWGGVREIPKHFPMGGQYGIPRRLYSDTANTRFEYFRLGKDPGQYQFEIPDRYVKYVEFYAQSKALERDGPGQDLALSGHFMQRFDEGVERTKRRLVEHKKSRIGVIGGSGRSQARPGLARLPYQYGRASRYR